MWHAYCFDAKTGYEKTNKNIRPVKTFALEERSDGYYLRLPTQSIAKAEEFSY
jgi:nitrite reductase/ring-hydroxylating ferredoxin subunit